MKKIIDDNRIAVSLEKIHKAYDSSLHTGVYKQPYFSGNWHYHPEFELLLITGGEGKRLVGDQVGKSVGHAMFGFQHFDDLTVFFELRRLGDF